MRSDRGYQSNWSYWSRTVIVSVAILLLNWIGLIRPLVIGAEWVVNPALTFAREARVRTDRFVRQIKYARNGAIRIIDLEREVAELATSVARVSELTDENEKLRAQIGLLPVSRNIVEGEVISSSDDALIVNLSRAGAMGGQAVLWKDSVVGYVDSVGGRNVAVRLMSDSEYIVEARIISASGIVVGEGQLRSDQIEGMIIEDIGRESDISEGMLVVTRGDERFISDLIIGKIARVISSDADVLQSAVVSPVYNIAVGDLVFVMWEDQ